MHVVGSRHGAATSELVAAVAARLADGVAIHHDPATFLAAYDRARAACLVVDFGTDAPAGLQLLEELATRGEQLPTLVLAADAAVETIVAAIRLGAADFHRTPPEELRLFARLAALVGEAVPARDRRCEQLRWQRGLEKMTPREREVFAALGKGLSAKQIAEALGTSIRTAHIHRANVMQKLDVDSHVRVAEIAQRLLRLPC